jgi:cell division protein FtsZ
VHTLEDEQKATYSFSDNPIQKTAAFDSPISNNLSPKIVYVLEDEAEEEAPKMNLVPTTENIKNTQVVFDEIAIEDVSEDDFVITNVTTFENEIVAKTQETNQLQGDLLFDLPLNSYTEITPTNEIRFDLNEVEEIKEVVNVNDIEVFGAEEIIFEKKIPETRYVLEDFDVAPTIGKSSSIASNVLEEESMQFELKSAKPKVDINNIVTESEEVSPLSLTISELQKRAEERRKTMKGFNYKFSDQMNKNIDDLEREPAYKRLGIDIDLVNTSISKSKTPLSNESDAIQLKSNNSFLHDNVD